MEHQRAYTNKEASKQNEKAYSFWPKDQDKGSLARTWGNLIPHPYLALSPTVVTSVEARNVNKSSIRSGGLINLDWWHQWIPSR